MSSASEKIGRQLDRYNLIVLALFMLVLLFFGGASRVDSAGQVVTRVAAVLVMASAALQIDLACWRRAKMPLVFLGLWAAIIAVQLIPLPPGMWAALPGRSVYLDSLGMIGARDVWRPISLTPDRTLNALLALLPAAAAMLTVSLLRRENQIHVLTLVLVAIAISTILGVFQVATGWPYLYAVTNPGSAVGSFANRNHAALFLGLAFPFMAAWVLLGNRGRQGPPVRAWIAAPVGVAIFPVLLVTGSRGGLLLGGLGVVAALLLEMQSRQLFLRGRRLLYLGAALIAGVAAIALFVLYSRAEAIQRLLGNNEPELRADLFPLLVKMAGHYFPVGSGFGSFEYVYRMIEPQASLTPFYLNQAHNDAAQIVIEGGLPALAFVLAFAAWAFLRALRAWTATTSESVTIARTASLAIAMIAIGSLFDYPLRTPLIAVVLALMSVWLAEASNVVSSRPRHSRLLGKSAGLG